MPTASVSSGSLAGADSFVSYPIVDTSQSRCYDSEFEVDCDGLDPSWIGQDAQYGGKSAAFQDNGDGTVSDLVTGLMWQQDPGVKMTYQEAVDGLSAFALAGYTDWRLPTIKELYSLILFDGTDPSSCTGECTVRPFIDTRYFNFSYGDTSSGERIIDSQFASSTLYVAHTFGNADQTMFGVNFADGRIKGYGLSLRGQEKTFFVLYVRGNPDYGKNAFVDNGNGTVTDNATGLTWMQSDSGSGMDWSSALNYCESLDLAGSSDWRLPSAKELQSIVDYTRSPDTNTSAALDPVFTATTIRNEAGNSDWPYFWTSTTHAGNDGSGRAAVYIAFGRALGFMNDAWTDVHGAGAQRSDPKTGDAGDYPQGRGPQGDAIHIENFTRCVRGGDVLFTPGGIADVTRPAMSVFSTGVNLQQDSQALQRQAPPAEAISACATKTEGSVCSFAVPSGTNTGTCQVIDRQKACIPNH